MKFERATKKRAKLRLALIGPAGSGKTYSALSIAQGIGGRIAVLDTEHGSASKYAHLFEFDTMTPDSFAPDTYVQAIACAERAGYDVLIIDSLSHAWAGKDGALEQVDRGTSHGDKFGAWRKVTPQHNALVEAILAARLHVIATLRTKMDYVMEKDEKTGKTTVRKVGLAPVQRDGLEFEFDVVADLDTENIMTVGKTRCSAVVGLVVPKPGAGFGETLRDWLTDGASEPTPAPAPAAPPPVVTALPPDATPPKDYRGYSAPTYETMTGDEREAYVALTTPERIAIWAKRFECCPDAASLTSAGAELKKLEADGSPVRKASADAYLARKRAMNGAGKAVA